MTEQKHHASTKASAKKVPAKKSAAKKSAPAPIKDARRAYEHLGRVRVLLGKSDHDKAVGNLLQLASRTFEAGRFKQSADLLRAAEHLVFAGLLHDDREAVSPELRHEIEHELDHLRNKSEEHFDAEEAEATVKAALEAAAKHAKQSLDRGALRAALDYARAAEALSHIGEVEHPALPAGASSKLPPS